MVDLGEYGYVIYDMPHEENYQNKHSTDLVNNNNNIHHLLSIYLI